MLVPSADRAYFVLCRALAWLLRFGRYSTVRIVFERGKRCVRKRRAFYAPVLVSMAGLLYWLLDTGVRIVPQRVWEQREDRIYRTLYGSSIQIDLDGLLLPCLAGETLASVLEHPALEESKRTRAIEWAIRSLAEFHRLGFTHADAMAENVMVDSDARIARWFDFETTHQPGRAAAWQRADDLRALLVSCLARTAPHKQAATLDFILDVYDDDEVTRTLASSFTSVWQRPLAFHLSQGSLTFEGFREAARVITARIGE